MLLGCDFVNSITSFSIFWEYSLDIQYFPMQFFCDLHSLSDFRIISLIMILERIAKQKKKTFHWLRCSSCGTFLASQGDGPDQYLTIWKWVEEKMVARKSAPAPEHYQLAFAHDQHNKITSCGKSRNFNLDSVWQNFATRFLPTLLHYLTIRRISLFSLFS